MLGCYRGLSIENADKSRVLEGLSDVRKWAWEIERLLLFRKIKPFQNAITTAHPANVH